MMTAHIVFDALDPGVPATLSFRVVTELLRREIGYTGLVFSDDLEMRALSDRRTVEESAVAAVRAGCDVLLVCERQELAERAHLALVHEAERDESFRARCHEAAGRSRIMRRKYPARPAPTPKALERALGDSGAAGILAELRGRSVPPGAT
jgi:beta-N-acetylhexosaminidase